MFSVLAEGPRRFRLENGTGSNAGWIRGKSIGFRGLRNDAEAIVAASAGWRTLQSLLHGEGAARPRQKVDWEHLRFVNDGAYEWVSDGRMPLARVYRTGHGTVRTGDDVAGAGGSKPELAIEFVVPTWMSDESVIPLAHALWHALAPLLGETTYDASATRRASHRARLPSAPTYPPAVRLTGSLHSTAPESAA